MEAFHYEDLRYLAVPLPEDIRLRKDAGDFEGAIRLCKRRMKEDIPQAMRKRLSVEILILERLPKDFPLTYEEAFKKVLKVLPDMTKEEFLQLQDDGRIDWIYIDGQERFFGKLDDTLLDAAERNRRSLILLGKIRENEKVPVPEGTRAVRESIARIRENGKESWKFRIRASLKIRDAAFRKGNIRVWLPYPRPCAQIDHVELIEASSAHFRIAPDDAPQRTILFEEDLEENREFFAEYEFVSTTVYRDLWSGSTRGNDTGVQGRYDPPPTAEDLEEDLPHIVFSPYMRALAEKITEGKDTDLERARSVYDFVTKKVQYSYQRSYFTNESLAEYAAVNLKGDCGIQALLFITLLRICGIPARWQSALQLRTDNAGCHDWAQFYLPEYGWLAADPSAGGGAYDAGDEQRRRFYFGNIDPFRMAANSAFMRPFDPPTRFLRADPYDNQTGEAEDLEGSFADEDLITKRKVTRKERLF